MNENENNINYDTDSSIVYDESEDEDKIIEIHRCMFKESDYLCNEKKKCYRCTFKASMTKLTICPYGFEDCLNANCDICKYKSRYIYTDRFVVKKTKHHVDNIFVGETFTKEEMKFININIRRGYWSDVFDVIVEVNQFNEDYKKIFDSFIDIANPIVNEFIRTKKMLIIFVNIDEYTDVLGVKHVSCIDGVTKEYNRRMKLMYGIIDVWVKENVDKVIFVKLFQNYFNCENIFDKFEKLLLLN